MRGTISVTEMARNFAKYINRVAFRGERFVLVRGEKPVAEIGPVPAGKRLGDLPSLFASLPHLTPREAEEFARDIEDARKELGSIPTRDPWES